MESAREEFSNIEGWGTDLDKRNRPAYPKERMPPRLPGVHWDQPVQQRRAVEVFHSTERPGITPVFGTSVPPAGVSGMIRRRAYKLSENDIRHWLMLLFADRVDVVEGLLTDARKSPQARVAAGAIVVGALAYLLVMRPRARRSR